MGNSYVNYTLRGPGHQAVAAVLAGRNAIVTPAHNGCVAVFDEKSDEQTRAAMDDLGARLSRELHCPVLSVLVHDDDLFCYHLFDRGDCIDRYDSSPGYFDPSAERTEPAGGNAGKLCGAFGVDKASEVESILRKSDGDAGYTFATDRHADLVQALGLPDYAVASSYASVSSGELPDGLSEEDLVRTTARGAAGARNAWSLGLECWLQDRVEGVPLVEAKDFFIARLGGEGARKSRRLLPSAELIVVDFAAAAHQPSNPPAPPKVIESVFAPLDEFIPDQPPFLRWYSAATGLATVRDILARVRDETAPAGGPPNLSPAEEARFWKSATAQLEHLERVLLAAELARTRFLLVYEDE